MSPTPKEARKHWLMVRKKSKKYFSGQGCFRFWRGQDSIDKRPQSPGYLLYTGDYTTHFCGDYIKPFVRIPMNQSIQWNAIRVLNVDQLLKHFFGDTNQVYNLQGLAILTVVVNQLSTAKCGCFFLFFFVSCLHSSLTFFWTRTWFISSTLYFEHGRSSQILEEESFIGVER